MKRFFNALLFCCFAFSLAFAVAPQQAVADFVRQSGVPSGSMAVKIIDLADGKVLAAHNPSLPLVPASIMKSVTTAALLGEVGPDWKYHTRVFIDGPNDLGYLRGNIIVVGNCDPTLNSLYEPYSADFIEEIAVSLSGLLINRIEGGIIIDQSEFNGKSRPSSWAAGDFKKYYGTGSHAFNFSDNARGDFAVENPSLGFVNELKKHLASQGIEVEDKEMPEGVRIQVLDHTSAPLDEIMRSCMMRSDNLFAESMFRTYGKLKGGDGSSEQAALSVNSLWENENMPLEGVRIVDGSGLSRSNRMTADFMAHLLQKMSGNPYYASFFPLAGQEGTLRKFLVNTPLDSYVAMKTGSMNGIQCYAGYKLDDDYMPTHVIVIIMNDLPKNKDRVKKAAEKMLLSLFE